METWKPQNNPYILDRLDFWLEFNYIIEINNDTISEIKQYTISVVINSSNKVYENGTFIGIPFTVRQLTTTITYNPVPATPYGNNVTITLFYIVSDSESWYHNGEFIPNSNMYIISPNWTEGVDYEYTANPSNYTLEIKNESILSIGVHYIDVKFVSPSGVYKNATFYDITFTIRALTTRITYTAVPDTPYGNNVSIYLVYEVSDPQSLWYNGQFITNGQVTVISPSGWILHENYTYVENPSNYTLIIGNNTVNEKPLVFWKDRISGTIPANTGQIILLNCSNIVISNQELSNTTVGVETLFSSNITIKNSRIFDDYEAMKFIVSNHSIIENNTIYNIWGKAEWLEDYFKEVYPSTPDGINCSEHQVKFKLIGEPPNPPTQILTLNESNAYVIVPCTNAMDL